MGTPGPQKINRYGIAFKLRAVQMSHQPGVLIKDVAESLCIHPFMLSRWRKDVRNGELVGSALARLGVNAWRDFASVLAQASMAAGRCGMTVSRSSLLAACTQMSCLASAQSIPAQAANATSGFGFIGSLPQ